MFSRFSPASQQLHQAVTDQRYGPLNVLEIEGRTALLWPGYDLTLQTLALDMMHADLDHITRLLGQPDTVHVAGIEDPNGHGSVAEVLLRYPHAVARCTSSALMPKPYGMRGGWRATFIGAVLEYVMRAGFTGQGPATLTEYTADGERAIELPDTSAYTAMIDHVLACLANRAENRITPASALPALELTLAIHHRLTHSAG
jgi:predicted dehydrogenase